MKNKYLPLIFTVALLPQVAAGCELHQQPMFGWAGGSHQLPVLKPKHQPNFKISSERLDKTALDQVVSMEVDYTRLQASSNARINLKSSRNVELLSAKTTELTQPQGKHQIVFKVVKKGYSYIQVSIESGDTSQPQKDHHTIYIPLAKTS